MRQGVISQSAFQWLLWLEAAGVGAWGRTFQVWAALISWGTCGGANGVSTVQTYKSVSELTTRPRLGEDCLSRGLQSALLLDLLLGCGISQQWRLPGLMPAASPLPKGQGNRDLHALPGTLRSTRLVGLAPPFTAETPSAAVVVAAIAARMRFSPQSGVAATTPEPVHG